MQGGNEVIARCTIYANEVVQGREHAGNKYDQQRGYRSAFTGITRCSSEQVFVFMFRAFRAVYRY